MPRTSDSLFKVEFAIRISDIERYIKSNNKKSAMLNLIATRLRLNAANANPRLKEEVDDKLTILRYTIISLN